MTNMEQFIMMGVEKLKVIHKPDKFDSARDQIYLIDGSKGSLSHPQGPTRIATLNVATFAPYEEYPLATASLFAASPLLLESTQQLLKIVACNVNKTISDEGMKVLQSDVRRAVVALRKAGFKPL